jgi:hypothetical protein
MIFYAKFGRFSIATQRILVQSQIWQREVKEPLKLSNLHTDHVTIQSELKYLFGAKNVNFKCRVIGVKTSPFPTVQVFYVVRPIATVWVRVEPYPELTRDIRTCYQHYLHQSNTHPILAGLDLDCGSILLYLHLCRTLAAIKFLGSDHIRTWSMRRLCDFSCACSSRFQISNLSNICWINEIAPNFTGNSPVLDTDSTIIGWITNPMVGGQRADNTAQSTYWSYYDTIRTQIHYWSQTGKVEMLELCWYNRPNCDGPGFWYSKTRSNGPEPEQEFRTVTHTALDILLNSNTDTPNVKLESQILNTQLTQ